MPRSCFALLSLCLVLGSTPAQGMRFADYWPLGVGYSVTMQNANDPTDQFVWQVFTPTVSYTGIGTLAGVYGLGDPSPGGGYFLASNDGIVFGIHATVDNGVVSEFDDVYLGDVQDGGTFSTSPTDASMIRDWDTLRQALAVSHPSQLTTYNIPNLSGLLVWVWYDTAVTTPNTQNTFMETGLPSGVVPPTGAVTDIDWLVPGGGPLVSWGVQAASGMLGPRYDQSSRFIDCNANGIDDATDIANGTSMDLDGNGIPDYCDIPVPPLYADVFEISTTLGGMQTFSIEAGTAQGSRVYLLLGSLSGNWPGQGLGSLLLPLNVDAYTQWSFDYPNTAPLAGSLGVLSTQGSASATLTMPPGLPASLVGLSAHHAYLVHDPGTGAITATSNAVPVVLR